MLSSSDLPDNMNDLITVFTDESHLDVGFSTDILGAKDQLQPLADQLTSLGLPEEADNLASLISGTSFDDLSSFVSDNIGKVLDNANLHQTLSSIEGALGQSGSGSCPGLDKAFGPFMGGRSVLSSISSLQEKIPQLGSLKGAFDSAQSQLTNAQSQFNLGQISSGQLAGFQSAFTSAQGSFNTAKSTVSGLTSQVNETMSSVGGLISDAENFVGTATSKLTTFTDALKVNALSKDPCMQAVIGAVGSSNLLSLL